ncbi:hypothetical protein A6J40_12815 [Legionella longbeachae]|uniref:hypothetical protein n=1 Tax=Legionella longbeachae TaxID=450 RepID=UPI0009B74285|nr:hypothetical protein [Legionella longbeachae]ARB93004.1 hypothetical protein A6J40_12815 [Legionella longbeachae]RZV26655.1 hypothetical protein EKG34_05840 [Legionella longbeachae]UAK47104.1 hypothetical protein K8O86_02615 [Legionella longbeachae]VEE04162.1 cyanophycin synthetase [Legionella oakridgensis]
MSTYVKNFDAKEIKSSRGISKFAEPVQKTYTNEKHCEHCYPEKCSHSRMKFFNLFDYFILNPFIYILSKLFLISKQDFVLFNNLLNQLSITVFQKLNLFTKTKIIDRKQVNNSILAFWDEAQRRGLELYNFKESHAHTSYFMLVRNTKKYYFTQTPVSLISQKSCFDEDTQYDNKWIFKKKLLNNKIPCPTGRVFISRKNAYNYGISLGFPLVVKPLSGSLSIHTSCNIKTSDELKEAIKIVKQVDFRVLVEKHIPGEVYRSVIVNDSLIACVMRQPESIIGDGVTALQQLINKKNKMAYPNKITPNSNLMKTLAAQGVAFNRVINKGQQIFISNKVTMSSRAKISNVTDLIHPENTLLLEKVHKILNIPLTGLDFICQDISLPWHKQQFGIIENNSFPYINLHLNPSDGKGINVAGKIWDYVLDVLSQKNE